MTQRRLAEHGQDADPARRRRAAGDAARTRSASSATRRRSAARSRSLHAQSDVGRNRRRDRRRARDRRGRQARLPRRRVVHVGAALAARPAHRGRPARRRQDPPRRRRRKPARLQRRDDELRARARDDAARRRDGLGARLGRLDRDGVRRAAAQPPVDEGGDRASATRCCSPTPASTCRRPREPVLSPNGDGVAEAEACRTGSSARRPCRRRSSGPDGTYDPDRRRRAAARDLPLHVDGRHAGRHAAAEGLWRFAVTATDDPGRSRRPSGRSRSTTRSRR